MRILICGLFHIICFFFQLFQSRRRKGKSQTKEKEGKLAGANSGSVAPQVLGDLVNAAAVTLASSAGNFSYSST